MRERRGGSTFFYMCRRLSPSWATQCSTCTSTLAPLPLPFWRKIPAACKMCGARTRRHVEVERIAGKDKVKRRKARAKEER